jgi:hypothetical protein
LIVTSGEESLVRNVIPEPGCISERLQKLRERVGLSVEDAAARMDLSPFHVEIPDEDFTREYSAADARRFCQMLNSRPDELLGVTTTEGPLSTEDLVRLIGNLRSQRQR